MNDKDLKKATQLLSSIGLSDKEVDVYLALLEFGTRSSSFIVKKTKLSRGTAYFLLHSLLEKGLVSKSSKGSVQHFSPLHPQQLQEYLKRRQAALKKVEEEVGDSMGMFMSLLNPLATRPKIEFFEGVEGAQRVLDDALKSKEKLIRGFFSLIDFVEFLGTDFLARYTQKRIDKGYTAHVIRTKEKDKEAIKKNVPIKGHSTSKKERRTVKFVDEDLAFPMSVILYDNKVALISSKEEGFALRIESQEFTSMMKKIFDLLWKL